MIVCLVALAVGFGSCAAVGLAQDIPADTEIVTTDSGLRYSVLVAGKEGPSPELTDRVVVHHTGWLTTGQVFATSRAGEGKPAHLRVGGAIEGWNEALQKMTPGARWKLHVPAALGYGARGLDDEVPPNSDLIYDLELIEFEKGPGLPAHRRVDADQAETIGTACKMQVLVEGRGKPATPSQRCIFHYVVFSESGECEESSLFFPRAIKLEPSRLPMPFLQQALTRLKPGAKALIEVPAAEQGLDADEAPVTWQVEILTPVIPDLSALTWRSTGSGLEYTILKEGTAERAAMGDQVTVDYSGWLADGVMFDSSVGAEPLAIALRDGDLIQGWLQGIPLVGIGGRILLRIPSDLAYGDRGRPPTIPGRATLIFEIDLIRKE